MDSIIAFDSHKRYTLASVETKDGQIIKDERISHSRGNIAGFLSGYQRGSPVAVETIGNWYWIIDIVSGFPLARE